jgi:hypothetical protein
MKWAKLLLALSTSLAVTGCLSAARRSSGAIGCPADDIVISDESVGFLGDHTWTAVCHDKTYFCSMNSGEKGAAQVSCSPSNATSTEPDRGVERVSAAPPSPGDLPAAPTAAAGFEFGSSKEQVTERCSAAEGVFTPSSKGGVCSKPAAPVGFDGEVTTAFSGTGLCTVTVAKLYPDSEATPLTDKFAQLVKILRGKYGKNSALQVPSGDCKQQIAACLRRDSAIMMAKWKWPDGHEISLGVTAPENGLLMTLRYKAPGQAMDQDVVGL